MKRLMFGTVALILSGCAKPPIAPAIAPAQTSPITNRRWSRFVSKECGFSVLMPGVPSIQKSKAESKNGVAHITNFGLSPRKGGDLSSYIVICGQFPQGHLQKFEPYDFLERTWKGRFSDTIKDDLVYQKRIVYEGFPAIEFQYKSKSPHIYVTTARYCLAGNNTYLVSIIASQNATSKGYPSRYLDSFRVLK